MFDISAVKQSSTYGPCSSESNPQLPSSPMDTMGHYIPQLCNCPVGYPTQASALTVLQLL
eukprot:3633748-Pyramimonas_sp.AAC.1